jgi:endonuclease/exonuclease/phosphatase family metal-dependent hydrolase
MPYYKPIKHIADKTVQKRIIDKLLLLRQKLQEQIPQKTVSETLLIATWNIREFGMGNRIEESFYYIAEIISRFDIIAIQELAGDLAALDKVMSILGRHWDFIVTDSTEGSAGGNERMAFLYDSKKLTFKNLAGEIVLPEKSLIDGKLQFARTPFCVAFQAGWFMFNLTTVHIYYGKEKGEEYLRRVAEIDALSGFLTKRAEKENVNYILLGDFNIVDTSDLTMKALEKNKFVIPEAIKQKPTDMGGTKHYDQIAFKLKEGEHMYVFSEKDQKAGAFNFFEFLYTPAELPIYKPCFSPKNTEGKTDKQLETYYLSKWRTFQISDHLPLWVELKIDFSDQFLKGLAGK